MFEPPDCYSLIAVPKTLSYSIVQIKLNRIILSFDVHLGCFQFGAMLKLLGRFLYLSLIFSKFISMCFIRLLKFEIVTWTVRKKIVRAMGPRESFGFDAM